MIVEIVILAMIAAFLGLRLYSVLGRRAEQEEESAATPLDRQPSRPALRPVPSDGQPAHAPVQSSPVPLLSPAIEDGLRAIKSADSRFDLLSFLEGAKGAYAMVLEAYWRGDKEELRQLCDDDVYQGFVAAIDAREAAGETLDNRLIRIDDFSVQSASLEGPIARIAVRFATDIAAVTRDRDGTVIAGSLEDAVESLDVWTFVRDVRSDSPAWLIDETDEG